MKDEAKDGAQDLADELERAINRVIRLSRKAEKVLCNLAEDSPSYESANAFAAEGLGHFQLGKAAMTKAGNSLPDITVQFGGK